MHIDSNEEHQNEEATSLKKKDTKFAKAAMISFCFALLMVSLWVLRIYLKSINVTSSSMGPVEDAIYVYGSLIASVMTIVLCIMSFAQGEANTFIKILALLSSLIAFVFLIFLIIFFFLAIHIIKAILGG